MSFFLHASSSDCERYFPSNKPSSFQVKLPNHIDGGKYEVALLQISFNNNRILLTNELDRKVDLYFGGDLHSFLIPCQKFNSVREFINCLSEMISDFTSTIQISYTEDYKCLIKTINSELEFSKKVACILGMSENRFTDAVKYGQYTPSLDNISHNIYVCMDGVVPQLTGNGYLPYLCVMYPSNAICQFDKSFFPSMYVPLKPHRIQAVRITLKDRFGKEVLLTESETQVFLHFRVQHEQRHLFSTVP